MKISIANPQLLEIFEDSTNKTYYGCKQQWFRSTWQRLAGCGPSAGTNIYLYMTHSKSTNQLPLSKDNWLSLMEEIWTYVTPSIRGVNKTRMFYEPLQKFMHLKGLDVEYKVWDVPKEKWKRAPLVKLIDFLEEALRKDAPIAFLNLCNGKAKFLDRWHWVTIIALDYDKDNGTAYVDILDQGVLKKIDLALWYETTTLGGGFVYFQRPEV